MVCTEFNLLTPHFVIALYDNGSPCIYDINRQRTEVIFETLRTKGGSPPRQTQKAEKVEQYNFAHFYFILHS